MSSQLLPLWTTTALDDTFLTMSTSDLNASSILGPGLLPPITNNSGQQIKPTIQNVPLGGSQDAGISSRPSAGSNPGDQNQVLPVEEATGSQSTGQQAGQSAAGGSAGGGGGQPPGRDGNHPSASSISSQDKTSGESTGTSTNTTTSSSMPELVEPPPDLFSTSLLYSAAGTSTPEELRKGAATGEISDAGGHQSDYSDASTAVVSDIDAQGRSLRQHYGLHVVDVNNPYTGGNTTSTTSSSTEKAPDAPLDTTVSTLSSFTNTSLDKSKSSDSSDHLDTSRENICDFRVSLEMFASQEEYNPSTSTPAPTAGCLNFVETTEESDGSEFLIPPSTTGTEGYSMGTQSSSFVTNISDRPGFSDIGDTPSSANTCVKRPLPIDVISSETEVPAKRKQLELHLDLPTSGGDSELVRPSRRAVVDMAMKATRGEFLMKSMQKTEDSGGGASAGAAQRCVLGEGDFLREGAIASSAGPVASDLQAEVEPSSKIMRQIVFDSLTSSDESSIPSSKIAAGRDDPVDSKGGGDVSKLLPTMAAPKPLTETKEPVAESNRLRLLIDSQEHVEEAEKPAAGEDIVEDTEEDEVEEDLILRYSPSQTSQSQYYPLVPETDPDSQVFTMDKLDGKSNAAETGAQVPNDAESGANLRLNLDKSLDIPAERETNLPSFELRRPLPSVTPSTKVNNGETSVGQETPTAIENLSSDEDNPFETENFFGKPADAKPIAQDKLSSNVECENVDEPDVPTCPVGRHKRKNVWVDPSEDDLSGFTHAYVAKKQPKLAGRAFGCQVDLVGGRLDKSVTEDEGEPKAATSKAVQTVLSGEIKAALDTKRSDIDEPDKSSDGSEYFRRTIVVRRTITEELIREGKVVSKNVFEEEDEPVTTEYTGREIRESAVFARPSPPDGSSSSKSASTNVSLNKSISSSSLTSGILGDVSSLSKSTPSSKQTSSDERPAVLPASKTGGDMRTLRSVRRRKFFEVRKNLALSESDSTPEMTKSVAEVPAVKKQGRPKSKTRVFPKKRSDGDDVSPLTTPKRIAQQSAATESPAKHSDAEPSAGTSSRKRKTQSSSAVRVMARWRDGYYYPGLILERERDDRVTVEYDDGDIRSIKSSDVLLVDVLPVGQSVYAQSPDGYYDSSIVVDHYEDAESGDVGYVIEIDGGTQRRVIRSRVILTSDQAACMEANTGTPPATRPGTANISLDNLVEGKRRSGPRTPTSTTDVQHRSPRTRRTARKIDVNAATTAAAENEGEDEAKANPSSDS